MSNKDILEKEAKEACLTPTQEQLVLAAMSSSNLSLLEGLKKKIEDEIIKWKRSGINDGLEKYISSAQSVLDLINQQITQLK